MTTGPESETRVAGRYRIDGQLAEGGMAVVYRAFDELEGRPVVLKRLRSALGERPDIALLFQREYHTLAQIRHPRIIEVYEYGVDASGPYYTMELLDGQDLRELAPIAWREACTYLRDVAYSLALLHTRRLLHRDLSPRNVRRTSDGRAKLFDFGTMATFGVPRDVVGTAPLVPPEALRGVALDHRADLYALGALAYFVLTRKHAYPVRTIEELPDVWQRVPTPPSAVAPDIPKALEDLVLSLLSMDPASRPAHAAEVIERLDAISGRGSDELGQVALSYLLSSQLVGRDHEMSVLDQYLERTIAARGRALLLEGNPGVGRTRVLTELSLRSQVRGALVVGVAAARSSAPNAVVRELVRGLLRAAPRDTARAAAPYLPVLAHVVPELADKQIELAVLPDDPIERRTREQSALLAFFTELSQIRPLVVLVDDLQRADEASAALLAVLASECESRALLVVVTLKLGSPVAAPEALRVLRNAARSIRLHRLGRSDTAALVRSVFGVVPSVDRVASWMHDITTGNPTQLMELARHLVETGGAQYAGGIWVLPVNTMQRAVPESLAQSLGVRLAQLSPGARELAHRASVADGSLDEVLLRWIAADERTLVRTLDELVHKGVLERRTGGYEFVHDVMRELVLAQLGPDELARHHVRLGEALLERNASGDRLASGAHLMRGGDASRGARLFAQGVRGTFEMHGTDLPALEQALAVYEREHLGRAEVLRMRAALVRAGYMVDRALAYKYGEPTLLALRREAGLALTDALAPWLGSRAALAVGLGFAYVRYRVSPGRLRGLHPASAVRQFVQALTSMLGAMSLGIDVDGVRRMAAHAKSLLHFPDNHAVRAGYMLCESLFAFMYGREDEHRRACRTLASALAQPKRFENLAEPDRATMLDGSLLALGICESFYADAKSEEVARQLEASPSHLGQLGAQRVHLVRHALRGEQVAAEERRRAVELLALKAGVTTWQVELWSAAVESLATLLTEDYLSAKQMLEVFRGLVPQAPSLGVFEAMLRARALRRNGQLDEALVRIAELSLCLSPREHVGWDSVRLIHAEVLLAKGEVEPAARLLRESLQHFGAEDELLLVRIMLERLLALADARLGRLGAARDALRSLIERVEPTEHPLVLARLHEAALELAMTAGDRQAATLHLERMEAAVEVTGNSALLALLHSAAQSARELGIGAKPPRSAPPEALEPVTAVSSSPGRRRRSTHPG